MLFRIVYVQFSDPSFFTPESYFVSIIWLGLNKFDLRRLSPKRRTWTTAAGHRVTAWSRGKPWVPWGFSFLGGHSALC